MNSNIQQLIKKVEESKATEEEKLIVLRELNLAAEEYSGLLKILIKDLKGSKRN